MAGGSWSPITDKITIFAAGGFTLETLRDALIPDHVHRAPPSPDDHRTQLMACVVKILPLNNIHAVPVREILRIRAKHATVRQTFLAEFDKIANTIENSPSPQQLKEEIESTYENRIKAPLDNLRSDLLALDIGTGVAAATTFVGAILKTASSVPVELSLATIAVGALAVIPLLTRRFSEGGPSHKHSMGYLHLLERDLSAAQVTERLAKDREARLKAENESGIFGL
jgi:hypothetical protein